jgi:hypothetical protein
MSGNCEKHGILNSRTRCQTTAGISEGMEFQGQSAELGNSMMAWEWQTTDGNK